MLPDPDVNGPPAPTDVVYIAAADGSLITTDYQSLRGANLAEQNAQRTMLNLPPLPDPATVTHGRPAVRRPDGQN